MKRSWVFFITIIICVAFAACGNSNNKDIDKELAEETKIETREDLLEIMGGVLEVDFSTLRIYHFKLNDPFYICGYIVPDNFNHLPQFELGDTKYALSTLRVTDYDFPDSGYKDGDFVYIKAMPNGESNVYVYNMSTTKSEQEYIGVEEYCAISKKIHNTYFEVTGFIGSVDEVDGHWTCKMYESKEAYKNDEIERFITLYFDEYPSNINGTTIRVVGKYRPTSDEPWLLHCSIIDE